MKPLPQWVGFVVGFVSTGVATSMAVGLIGATGIAHQLGAVALGLCTWVAVYSRAGGDPRSLVALQQALQALSPEQLQQLLPALALSKRGVENDATSSTSDKAAAGPGEKDRF